MQNSWQVEKIPILHDNFVYVLHNGKDAAIFDPGESSPVLRFLKEKNLNCRMILITHHHSDHIHGLLDIENEYKCSVYAPKKNKRQLRFGITNYIEEGSFIHFDDLEIHVMGTPGHTLGHIAYWIPEQKWLFSGDVLFALGCGRVFEGTFDQMFETLQKIKSLPDETTVFCTHDYFPNNERFCKQEGIPLQGYTPHFPLQLKQEKAFNPFLTADTPEVFRKIREKRNQF